MSNLLAEDNSNPSWRDSLKQAQDPIELAGLHEGDILQPLGGVLEPHVWEALNELDHNESVLQWTRLWPNGVVYYEFADDFDFLPLEKLLIKWTMNSIEKSSCVRFVERTTEYDYVKIIYDSYKCYSSVGRVGGKQVLSLGTFCSLLWDRGNIYHELLHALGFYHEHTRPDRDDHVEVEWKNIKEGMEVNFRKDDRWDRQMLEMPYDIGSVMHYSSQAFSKFYFLYPTIRSKEKGHYFMRPKSPSTLDYEKLNRLYNCPKLSRRRAKVMNWRRGTKAGRRRLPSGRRNSGVTLANTLDPPPAPDAQALPSILQYQRHGDTRVTHARFSSPCPHKYHQCSVASIISPNGYHQASKTRPEGYHHGSRTRTEGYHKGSGISPEDYNHGPAKSSEGYHHGWVTRHKDYNHGSETRIFSMNGNHYNVQGALDSGETDSWGHSLASYDEVPPWTRQQDVRLTPATSYVAGNAPYSKHTPIYNIELRTNQNTQIPTDDFQTSGILSSHEINVPRHSSEWQYTNALGSGQVKGSREYEMSGAQYSSNGGKYGHSGVEGWHSSNNHDWNHNNDPKYSHLIETSYHKKRHTNSEPAQTLSVNLHDIENTRTFNSARPYGRRSRLPWLTKAESFDSGIQYQSHNPAPMQRISHTSHQDLNIYQSKLHSPQYYSRTRTKHLSDRAENTNADNWYKPTFTASHLSSWRHSNPETHLTPPTTSSQLQSFSSFENSQAQLYPEINHLLERTAPDSKTYYNERHFSNQQQGGALSPRLLPPPASF